MNKTYLICEGHTQLTGVYPMTENTPHLDYVSIAFFLMVIVGVRVQSPGPSGNKGMCGKRKATLQTIRYPIAPPSAC